MPKKLFVKPLVKAPLYHDGYEKGREPIPEKGAHILTDVKLHRMIQGGELELPIDAAQIALLQCRNAHGEAKDAKLKKELKEQLVRLEAELEAVEKYADEKGSK
jgi:hypothetical protein